MDLYIHWLIAPVIDLGCGTGDTVRELRASGLEADGIDQIRLPNGMQTADITHARKIITYRSSICIDVLEHLHDWGCEQVLKNMKQTQRQAITIHVGSSTVHGIELHVNQKPVEAWQRQISRHLRVDRLIGIDPQRWLFLCERKTPGDSAT